MPTRCSQHPSARAGWLCSACKRTLCPDCARARHFPSAAEVILCRTCGGLANPIMVPVDTRPYWDAAPDFVRAMFTKDGLLQLLAVAIVLRVVSIVPGPFGLMLTALVFVSYYFQVITCSARGLERLPLPADFNGYEDFAVVTRYSLATAIIWAPAILHALWNVDLWELSLDPTGIGKEAFLRPSVLVLFALGVIYYPAALITGAIAGSGLAMFNPLITVRMILRIPGQYFLTLLVIGALAAANALLGAMLSALTAPIPDAIVIPTLIRAVGLVIELTTAFVLGRLIYQNAAHFDTCGPADLVRPEWPEARPRE